MFLKNYAYYQPQMHINTRRLIYMQFCRSLKNAINFIKLDLGRFSKFLMRESKIALNCLFVFITPRYTLKRSTAPSTDVVTATDFLPRHGLV